MNTTSLRRITIAALLLSLSLATAQAASPEVKVSNVRCVFDNGEHNAFTDMTTFRGTHYLTFRTCPDGHMVHPTSSIIVMASKDTKTWKQIYQFSVAKRDTRDPHFLVFKGKLFVYAGTWYCGNSSPKSCEINEQLGYGVWTDDGKTWSEPIMLEGTYGHYIWRAAERDGKAYLCGRRKQEFARTATRAERDAITESALLVSDDGLVWRTQGLFQAVQGNETAFLFEDNGDILAVARRGGSRSAQICRSSPPYKKWTRTDMDRHIGGPMLNKWGQRDVVAGRLTINGPSRTALYWLKGNDLEQFATLPSGGDNSYTGFLEFSPQRALISWYSSHEKDANGKTITAIYLADLAIQE